MSSSGLSPAGPEGLPALPEGRLACFWPDASTSSPSWASGTVTFMPLPTTYMQGESSSELSSRREDGLCMSSVNRAEAYIAQSAGLCRFIRIWATMSMHHPLQSLTHAHYNGRRAEN